jgi:hypothetical protein
MDAEGGRKGAEAGRKGEGYGLILRPALSTVEHTRYFDHLLAMAIHNQEGEAGNHEFAGIGLASRPPRSGNVLSESQAS